MNVLLIQPHFKKKEKAYPLGLGYISAFLKKNGVNTLGIDLSFYNSEEALFFIRKNKISLIGISLMSFSMESAISFCRRIKGVCSIPIVAGGPHVTIFREELFRQFDGVFDYLIPGEGERPFFDLVDALKNGASLSKVSNLIYKDNEKLCINGSFYKRITLDDLPFPDREIFPLFKYKGMFTKNEHYVQMITSRGCNNRCSYCPEPALRGEWCGRSAENVVSEISSIFDVFGIKEFHFEDSNFFGGGIERIKALCLKIIELKLKISWQLPNGIPVQCFEDGSILRLMAEAGCYSICLGIESFDEELMHKLNRGSDFERTKRTIGMAQDAGIEVIGYFIIGFPGQASGSIKRDARLSRKLNLDFANYSLFHFIPGSELYNFGDFLIRLRTKELKKTKFFISLVHCFKPRTLSFILRNLLLIKNPLRFLRRAIVYFFDFDLRY